MICPGDYGLVSLLEIIALHLDATYAACSVWRELASCFLKVSHCGEDQLSVCGSADEDIGGRGLSSLDAYPIGFIHGIARKSWELRCRWWPKRHFNRNAHTLEMEAGIFKTYQLVGMGFPVCTYITKYLLRRLWAKSLVLVGL